jgi:hypothetical protein
MARNTHLQGDSFLWFGRSPVPLQLVQYTFASPIVSDLSHLIIYSIPAFLSGLFNLVKLWKLVNIYI